MKTETSQEPRKRGRPPLEDKRRFRGVRFNDAEWEQTTARATAAGMRIAEFVRSKALEG